MACDACRSAEDATEPVTGTVLRYLDTLKSLPLVTLALILVNAVVYFVFQSGDRQAYARAADY